MATQSQSTKKEQQDKKQPSVIANNTILQLTLSWKEVEPVYQKALRNMAQNLKLKGFRKGKAPLQLAEAQLSRAELIEKTLETLIPAAYKELIAKEKKQPLTHPDFKPLSLEWNKDWVVEVAIAEKPTITLGKYQQAVKSALKEAAKELQTAAKVDQKKAPEKKDDKTPAVDPKKLERETKLKHIFRTLVAEIKPQIPELLLKEQTRSEIEKIVHELEHIGLTLDHYLQKRQQSFEDFSSELAVQTLGQLQLEFILLEIEADQHIHASEAEVEEEVKKITDPKMRQQLEKNPEYHQYLHHQLQRQKVLESLLSL